MSLVWLSSSMAWGSLGCEKCDANLLSAHWMCD